MLVPGVYGMRLGGLDFPPALMARVPDHAPELQVHVRHAGWHPGGGAEGTDLIGGGVLYLDEHVRSADFALDRTLTADELIHPWLAPAASAFALADGNLSLHGGVLAADGGAVAVVGDREAGKSSLVAAAAFAGVDVMTDDIVVVSRAGDVLAGPRCVDLRPSALEHFPASRTRVARDGTRHRLELPQGCQEAPLRAVVVLGWGSEVSMRLLSATERVAALLPHLASARVPRSYEAVLRFAHLPVLVLLRPRDWGLVDHTVERVLALTR